MAPDAAALARYNAAVQALLDAVPGVAEGLLPGARIVRVLIADAERPARPGSEWFVPTTGEGVINLPPARVTLPVSVPVERDPALPLRRQAVQAVVQVVPLTPDQAAILRAVFDAPLPAKLIGNRLGLKRLRHVLADMRKRLGLLSHTARGYAPTDLGRRSLAASSTEKC